MLSIRSTIQILRTYFLEYLYIDRVWNIRKKSSKTLFS